MILGSAQALGLQSHASNYSLRGATASGAGAGTLGWTGFGFGFGAAVVARGGMGGPALGGTAFTTALDNWTVAAGATGATDTGFGLVLTIATDGRANAAPERTAAPEGVTDEAPQ